MTSFRTAAAGVSAALLATTALGGLVLAGAYAASAQSSGPVTLTASTPSPSASADAGASAGTKRAGQAGGVKHACADVPVHLARAQRAQARLAGDASTKGSIAALEARVAAASAAGNQDAARLLGDLLAIRRDVAGILPNMVAKLQDAHTVCAQASPAAPATPATPAPAHPQS